MVTFKLSKIEVDKAIAVNTPEGTDALLAGGVLSLLDETGVVSVNELIRDVVGYRKIEFETGTPNVRAIDLTTLALPPVNEASIYSITMDLSNVTEYNGNRAPRTYVVSSDTTADIDEIGAAFALRINNDLNSGVTATYLSPVLTLAANSASYGELNVTNSFNISVAEVDPWIAPEGTTEDALQYFPATPASVDPAAEYTKYLIRHRKLIRHNAVSGLSVFKIVNTLVFVNSLGALYGAYETEIDSILSGAYTTSAYLATPSI